MHLGYYPRLRRIGGNLFRFALKGEVRRQLALETLSRWPRAELALAQVVAPGLPVLVVPIRDGRLGGATFERLLAGEALPIMEHSMEPSVAQLLETLELRGADVLDVGASYGYYSVLLSRLVGGTGRVCALEPDVRSFARLEGNLKRNGCRNVQALPVAASDSVGLMSFSSDQNEPWLGHVVDSHSPNGEPLSRQAVPVVTLDLLVAELGLDPLLLKIDVEGSEVNVLHGAREICSERRPLILVEVHSDSAMHGVRAWAENLGYECEQIDFMSNLRQHILLRPHSNG